MVVSESGSMSVLAMKLLVQTLLAFPGRTICVCPVFPRMEHLAERCFGRLVPEAFQGRDRSAAQWGFLSFRCRDGTSEGIGHDLDPGAVGEQAAARRDDFFELG